MARNTHNAFGYIIISPFSNTKMGIGHMGTVPNITVVSEPIWPIGKAIGW